MFIRNFRHPDNLDAEDDYYLMSFTGALNFIYDLDY